MALDGTVLGSPSPRATLPNMMTCQDVWADRGTAVAGGATHRRFTHRQHPGRGGARSDARGGRESAQAERPSRILLVEDNPGDADLVRIALEHGSPGADLV